MAIAWDGAGGLFTDVGKMVGVHKNLRGYLEQSFPATLTEIGGAIGDATAFYMEGLKDADDAFLSAFAERGKAVGKQVEARVLDPVKIIAELHLPTISNLDIVLPRLREQMVADSKTVKQCSVTLGGVTAGSLNVGNGTIIATKVLDGYNKPGDFFPADKNYNGVNSELCARSETITVECTADSQTSGRVEGGEAFNVYGHPPNPEDSTPTPYFGAGNEGSGSSTDTFVIGPDATTLLNVPGFEVWSSATPPVLSGWSIDTGTNDVNIKREATNKYRGSYALRFLGDGTTADLQVSQAPTISDLKPLRRYLISVRYKADAAIGAGDLDIEFTGTGYTAGGSEKISVAHGSLATSWTLQTFQINMPSVIPSDFKLIIKIAGTLTSAKNIYIDDVLVQPMYYFGGVAVAYVPGSTRAAKGDRWSFTVTNDRAGIGQSYWARYFGRQLPSSGVPSISDSLFTSTTADTGGPS